MKQTNRTKPATPPSFRPAFATHRLEDGYAIRTVQELLGHEDVETTRVSPHVLNRGGKGMRSPVDGLLGAEEARSRFRPG